MDDRTTAKLACRLLALFYLAHLISSLTSWVQPIFLSAALPDVSEYSGLSLTLATVAFIDLSIRVAVIAALWFRADRLATWIVPEPRPVDNQL